MAGSSSMLGVTHELVWPCPDELGKAWFILHDEEEVKLWHLLRERGLSMEFDLALTKTRLKEALERVELIHQAMNVDLPHIAEQEAVVLQQVDELRHQLESTRHESQDQAAEAMGAQAAKMRAVEWAAVAEQKLDMAKAHLVETEMALEKSLEALEAERKAQSDTEREVIMLQRQMLGVEESNTWLLKRVTWQEEGLSILEKLGGKIGSLEQELETVKVAIGRGVKALAQSLEEQHAL
ncbi:uncharacterized protein [Miscanthus floridulus]|uniref:uncharacterized protein n=1 Tax=Miscanthus floridulus TaxID=154761 RepID=UPI003458BC76